MFANNDSFEFDWISVVDSLKVIPFSCGEKILRRTSPRWIFKLDLVNESLRYIFRSAKSQGRINVLSIVSYVQCLAKRLTLNSIEFLHSQVWRSVRFSCSEKFYEEIDNKNMGRVFGKSNRFRFNWNCPIFSRATSFSLSWMHPIANLTVILLLCCEKLITLIRSRLLTVIQKSSENKLNFPLNQHLILIKV